jgi:Domain of unknown function (DUF1918)
VIADSDRANHAGATRRRPSMQASIGDRLHVHSNTVGTHDKIAEIIEVRGEHGGPPYRVRFPDGHETLVYPGPDSVIEQTGRT